MVIAESVSKMPSVCTLEGRLDKIKTEAKNEDKEQLDDSLTSLQWLQEVKINITNDVASIVPPYSPVPSTNSDDSRADDLYEGMKQEIEDDQVIDYKTNPHYKPPYSYATLICMAMKEANLPKMTLSSIYRWITDNFVYYKHADQSWQVKIYNSDFFSLFDKFLNPVCISFCKYYHLELLAKAVVPKSALSRGSMMKALLNCVLLAVNALSSRFDLQVLFTYL